MRKFALLLACAIAAFPAGSAFSEGGPEIVTQSKPVETVPTDIFTTESAYVFESDLNHGGSFGKQDELQNQFEYGHRFLLTGDWYLHLGLAYSRFDFGNTSAPVPDHLQSGAVVIGFDYMHGTDTGAFLQFRPGFYTEDHIGLASFDCPIAIGRFWVLQQDKLYVLTGIYSSFLHGGFPVLPLAGVVWKPNDSFRVMGVLPQPRAIYTINKQLEVWVGGELTGGAFRTDHHDDYVGPHVAKLSGTQVDYYDYRAGAGLIFSPTRQVDIDLNGGYAIQRSFNYHRAGEYYRTDPAPYVEIALKAHF